MVRVRLNEKDDTDINENKGVNLLFLHLLPLQRLKLHKQEMFVKHVCPQWHWPLT